MFWQCILRQRQPIQPFFHDSINKFMYLLQQRHLQRFLFRVRSHNYFCLIIILTQKEEHNQRFCQLSVEFPMHFPHFIHPYMNPLPPMDQALKNTYSKPAKGQGDIIGFTRRKEAVAQLSLIRHEKAKIPSFSRSICHLKIRDKYTLHHEFSDSITNVKEAID